MGEMCDFEAEYYPQAWNTNRVKNGKRRDVVIRLNATEYEAYKSIGGAVGARKLIVSEHKKKQQQPN